MHQTPLCPQQRSHAPRALALAQLRFRVRLSVEGATAPPFWCVPLAARSRASSGAPAHVRACPCAPAHRASALVVPVLFGKMESKCDSGAMRPRWGAGPRGTNATRHTRHVASARIRLAGFLAQHGPSRVGLCILSCGRASTGVAQRSFTHWLPQRPAGASGGIDLALPRLQPALRHATRESASDQCHPRSDAFGRHG